jgi:hypothetical protein
MIVVDECSTTFDQSNPAPPKRGRAHDQPEPEFSFRGARLLKPIASGAKREPSPWSGYVVPVLGISRHCPADKKLFSGKSPHITPDDDSWLARLLRRRLEQDVHETPPEPNTRRKKGREKPRMFFDEWLAEIPPPGKPYCTDATCLCHSTDRRFLVVTQNDGTKLPVDVVLPGARFKGVTGKKPFDQIISELENVPATWAYVHEDARIAKRHGLTDWIRRQDKPAVDQAETILFEKEYKNLHEEEAQQVKLSHTIKSKRNTGGPRPESAIEAEGEYRQWMIDKGVAREKSTKEVNKELADQRKEQEWNGSSPMMFGGEGRPIRLFGEAGSPTSMSWDGDSFVVSDDHLEYFQGRIIPERKRLTGAQRAAEFNDHKALVEAGAVVNLREDEIILDIKLEYITREEGAEKLEISVDALDKRIQRRSLEARAMQDGKFQIPYLALTYEQAADIADNDAVYLQVDLNGWRWCKLDVEKYGSVAQAIEGLKREKMSEALRQRREYKAAGKHGTNERYPGFTEALKEVKDRYDKQVFHPDRIRLVQRPPRPKQPWEGLIGDIVGDE